MDSNDSFVVFYSNYCNHSKEFLIRLKNMKNGIYEKFTKICVDNNGSIPAAIKSVPTILVPSHPYPLTDDSVMMWLDSMSNQYSSQQAPQMQMQMEEQVNNIPQMQNIEYNTEESKISSLFESLKKPLLIVLISFVIFNPVILNLLRNNLPKIFGETDNLLMRQGRTALLAILVGVIYFSSNLLM